MLCSVVKHEGNNEVVEHPRSTTPHASPKLFSRALPLPACFTTEQSTSPVEAPFWLITQHNPYISVLSTETNDSSQSHDGLLFSVDESHYLNAARVASSTAYDDFDCTFKCLRNPYCLSVNLVASKDANGKVWCELLSSNRHRNSLDYRENRTCHHLFLPVGSVSRYVKCCFTTFPK